MVRHESDARDATWKFQTWFVTFLDVLAAGVNHNLSTEEDVRALQIQNIVDAGSRTLGFVDSVDDQPRAVAVTLDRHFVPFAVVQGQGVDGDQALAAAEVESVPDEAKLCHLVSRLATFWCFIQMERGYVWQL